MSYIFEQCYTISKVAGLGSFMTKAINAAGKSINNAKRKINDATGATQRTLDRAAAAKAERAQRRQEDFDRHIAKRYLRDEQKRTSNDPKEIARRKREKQEAKDAASKAWHEAEAKRQAVAAKRKSKKDAAESIAKAREKQQQRINFNRRYGRNDDEIRNTAF